MQKLKRIWNVVSTALVVLIVLCAVFLMGSRIMGYRVYTVISGSMEPQYSVGDLVYVKQVDPATIRVGDDITFVLNEELVVATHRVVRIDSEHKHIYTKGLANDTEDTEPVHYKNVLGVVDFAIPVLGYVSNFIQNPPGMYITLGVGAALIILVFLPDFLPKKKEVEGTSADEAATLDENARLKEELEALKAQLQTKQEET
jgi:signal peptidase